MAGWYEGRSVVAGWLAGLYQGRSEVAGWLDAWLVGIRVDQW